MSNNNTNPEKSYNRQFVYNIPENILFDEDLSFTDIKLYAVIRSFMDTTGDAYPSNNWIAKKLSIDRTTAIRSINRLCKKFYLIREDINGHRHLKISVSSIREEVVASTPPPSGTDATPQWHGRHPIKSKIINTKNNKTTTTTLAREEKKKYPPSSSVITPEIDKKLLALRDEYIYKRQNRKHDPKTDRSDEEFLRQCSHHLDNGDKQKYNLVRRLKGLETIIKSGFFETPAGYRENKIVKSTLTPEENALFAKYQHGLRMSELGQSMSLWVTDKEMIEVNKIIEKIKANEQAKPLKLKDILAKGIPG